MYLKKIFNWTLVAMMTLAMTSTVSSCKDDDKDDSNGNNSEQRRDDADPMDTEQVLTATRWISALTATDTLGAGWAAQTYEPTIGRASEQNALTRLVVVADLDEARAEFASMANKEPGELGTTTTVEMEGVGSMTWNVSAQGAENLATVSVDIKQVPHLQKIVYCTEEQTGSNGIFTKNVSGTAYYRFGDVVRDNFGYYWVCVRPSFEKGDKGESHWVNIFNADKAGERTIPTEYIETKYNNKAKYQNQTLLLPTKLESDRRHIYNLSNLVWALLDPNKYVTACASNHGKGLGDFLFIYHGDLFVKRVAQYWSEPVDRGYNIWQLLFGYDVTDLKKVERMNFFYKGYSWKWGNNITFWDFRSTGYQAEYFGKDDADEVKMPYTEGFDVNLLAGDKNANTTLGSGVARIATINGHKEGKWLVRVVTGDKLCLNGKYDPYNRLSAATDVYRFNEKMKVLPKAKLQEEADLQKVMDNEQQAERDEEAQNAPKVGYVIGKDGKFYKTADAAFNKSGEAVAIVAYLAGQYRVEQGTDYNGLAIALGKGDGYTWSSTEPDCDVTIAGDDTDLLKVLDGQAMTSKLASGCGKQHRHNAASMCAKYDDNFTAEGRQAYSYSKPFMPSIGQWLLALKGFGYQIGDKGIYNVTKQVKDNAKAAAEKLLENSGVEDFDFFGDECWTTTRYTAKGRILTAGLRYTRTGALITFYQRYDDDGNKNDIDDDDDIDGICVRPFIAFKYNGGATKDF